MSDDQASQTEIIDRTRRWLAAYVIGLKLCPFAEPVLRNKRLALKVTSVQEPRGLLQALEDEIAFLKNAPSDQFETTLLIHPWALQDFAEYNEFLGVAEALLEQLGMGGVLQLASFHPDYCFAGEPSDDPANLTNRSPYPMLHLLRESSVSAALDAGADTEAIVNRNIELLRGLSAEALDQLRQTVHGA